MIDAGTLSIYAGVGPQSVEESSAMIYDVVADLKKNISRDELVRAQNYARAGMYLASESMEARMTRLAKNEMYFDRYYSLEEVDIAFSKVTLEEIFTVANMIFEQPMTSVVLGPGASG
jgi:predicted Zn-dependent peptidase